MLDLSVLAVVGTGATVAAPHSGSIDGSLPAKRPSEALASFMGVATQTTEPHEEAKAPHHDAAAGAAMPRKEAQHRKRGRDDEGYVSESFMGVELRHHPEKGTVSIELTETAVLMLYVGGLIVLISGLSIGCCAPPASRPET